MTGLGGDAYWKSGLKSICIARTQAAPAQIFAAALRVAEPGVTTTRTVMPQANFRRTGEI